MNPQLRRQIVREFPELAAGYHLPVMAEVIAISDAPNQGGISDFYRPRFAVDVMLITSGYQKTDIQLDAVPVSITGGGDERGFFALPQKGTLVELAWLNGSAERPFVRSVLADRQALPQLDDNSMSWQQHQGCYQRMDKSGNWQRHTDQSISDHSHGYQLQAAEADFQLGNELRRIGQHSIEDVNGIKQIEATAVHLLSASVLNLLAAGSVNQVAAEHSSTSASKNIKAQAGKNIEHKAGADIITTATANMELVAKKIKLGNGSDNLLTLISEFMQASADAFTAVSTMTVTCADPGKPSTPPVNLADFTKASADIGKIKAKVDGMTQS